MGECQKKMQRKCLLKLQKVSKSHDVHVGRCGGARCARWTLRYCLAHFKWTEAAVTYLAEQMKAATQEDDPVGEEPEEPPKKKAKSYYEKVDGMKSDGSPNNIRNAAADCCIRCRMSRVKFCCTCEVYEEPATVPVPFRTHVWLSGKYRKIYESPIVVKASHAQVVSP